MSKLGHLIQLGLDEMKNDPPDYFLYSAFVQISSSGPKKEQNENLVLELLLQSIHNNCFSSISVSVEKLIFQHNRYA